MNSECQGLHLGHAPLLPAPDSGKNDQGQNSVLVIMAQLGLDSLHSVLTLLTMLYMSSSGVGNFWFGHGMG